MSSTITNLFSPFEEHRLTTEFTDGCWHHDTLGGATADPQRETWRRGKVIGRGTYGTLVVAEGKGGAVRAIKEVAKVATPATISSRELQALAGLKSYSDHFVQFFGWWEDEENVCFAMEYIEGGDLMALIRRQKLTIDDTMVITKQLLEGLAIMHQNNFCHRDLKPENVLVISYPPSPIVVKIADFGCAKYAVGTRLRSSVGTDGYIAPEIWGYGHAETSVYSFKVDIWSLGCLLYTIITGEPPLQEFRAYIAYTNSGGPFPSEQLIEQSLNGAGIEFIMSLMAPLPEDRFTADQALKHRWLIGSGEVMHVGCEHNVVTELGAEDSTLLKLGDTCINSLAADETPNGNEETVSLGRRRISGTELEEVEAHTYINSYDFLIPGPTSLDRSTGSYASPLVMDMIGGRTTARKQPRKRKHSFVDEETDGYLSWKRIPRSIPSSDDDSEHYLPNEGAGILEGLMQFIAPHSWPSDVTPSAAAGVIMPPDHGLEDEYFPIVVTDTTEAAKHRGDIAQRGMDKVPG